jgi:hypothetical protein
MFYDPNHKSEIYVRYVYYTALHTHSVNGRANVVSLVRAIPGCKMQEKFI